MNHKITTILNRLAKRCLKIKPPVHIVAICSGGQMIGRFIHAYLNRHGVEATYDEVWTNIVNNRASIWKTTFRKENYKGTVLITEDVIWNGKLVEATKKMLSKMKRKKVHVAVLLDLKNKADFSIFHQ